MITEINGRMTCTKCGYEWSAMLGDDEIIYECESGECGSPSNQLTEDEIKHLRKKLKYNSGEIQRLLKLIEELKTKVNQLNEDSNTCIATLQEHGVNPTE